MLRLHQGHSYRVAHGSDRRVERTTDGRSDRPAWCRCHEDLIRPPALALSSAVSASATTWSKSAAWSDEARPKLTADPWELGDDDAFAHAVAYPFQHLARLFYRTLGEHDDELFSPVAAGDVGGPERVAARTWEKVRTARSPAACPKTSFKSLKWSRSP